MGNAVWGLVAWLLAVGYLSAEVIRSRLRLRRQARTVWVSNSGDVISSAILDLIDRHGPPVGWTVKRHLTFVIVDMGSGPVLYTRADVKEARNGS